MSTNQLLASGQAGQDLAVYHNGDFNAYMANKINKLNIMYNTGQGIATSIFFGCACLITGHTTPSLDELRRLILANGGIFHGYEQDSTTHFICDRFAAPKTVRMRKTRSRGKLFYVTAAWVVESVTAEKRLREILFLPRSLDTNGGSSMRTFVCNGENSKQVEDDLTVGALIAEAVANMDGDDELFDKFQPDIVPDDNTESPTLAATKRVHSSTNFNMNEAMLGYESDCTLIDSQTQSLPIDEAEDELNHAFIAEDEEEEKAEDYIDVEQEHGMIAERLDSIFSSPIPDPKNKSPLSRGALSTNDDPNFLNNFFSNSRLHFIGTWRNRLAKFAKRMLQQSKRDPSASTSTSSSRVVVHVDMDCFFVSVLTRSMPHLHDRPVVVAHGSSDGCEISSCNYKARAKGLKNGMFMRQVDLFSITL
jgi:DNA repair protein REV1